MMTKKWERTEGENEKIIGEKEKENNDAGNNEEEDEGERSLWKIRNEKKGIKKGGTNNKRNEEE